MPLLYRGVTFLRGTNISHWLSQSRQRGPARAAYFTAADVRRLKDLGLDHLRLPVDEEQLWDESGRPEPEAWALLDAALDHCAQAGLRAIVDLHILRSHYFNQKTAPALFTGPQAAAQFVDFWRQLSARLKRRPVDQVAYELLNEAVAADPEDWNRVALAAFAELRRLEPERTIVLGSNWFNQTHTFERLRVPEDPRCLLTFHFYHPMFITHYQAGWWDGGCYRGPVRYPGVPVAPEEVARLDAATRAIVERNNQACGPAEMVELLRQPLAVRERTGLPLYCGEFGCIEKAPRALRLAWYRDIAAVFKAHGIGWANWDYKGGFGLFDGRGQDTGIAAVLLG